MEKTMTQHTPGPWHVSGLVRAAVVIGDDVLRLGIGEASKANARLIAAAPDLLDSLVNLLGVIDGEGGTKPGAREMARAAIARAVGAA